MILLYCLTREKRHLEAVWSRPLRYQPTGIYFARVRFGGKLYRRALGASDFKLARRKLADFCNGLERTNATKGKTSFAAVLSGYKGGRSPALVRCLMFLRFATANQDIKRRFTSPITTKLRKRATTGTPLLSLFCFSVSSILLCR